MTVLYQALLIYPAADSKSLVQSDCVVVSGFGEYRASYILDRRGNVGCGKNPRWQDAASKSLSKIEIGAAQTLVLAARAKYLGLHSIDGGFDSSFHFSRSRAGLYVCGSGYGFIVPQDTAYASVSR